MNPRRLRTAMERRTVLCAVLQNVSIVAVAGQPARRPNVLYMVADDLRIELPAYGAAHVHAPALTQLVRRPSLSSRQVLCSHFRRDCSQPGPQSTWRSRFIEGGTHFALGVEWGRWSPFFTAVAIVRRRRTRWCSMQLTVTSR